MVRALRQEPGLPSIAANVNSRTLWYTLYDLTERRVQVDFYLNSEVGLDGSYHEERSQIFSFELAPVDASVGDLVGSGLD